MKNQWLSSLTRHVTDQSLIAMGLVCLLLPLVFTQADGGFFAPPCTYICFFSPSRDPRAAFPVLYSEGESLRDVAEHLYERNANGRNDSS